MCRLFLSASGGSLHLIKYFQHLFGPRTDSDVFRQIDPANCSGGVNQEFGRASNVTALRSSVGMQEIVTANDLRFRIGKERVSKTQLLPVSPIYFRCVNTERHYANAPRLKLRKPVLETPQLGVA